MRNALFVFLGAGLWATDTLFRQPLLEEISAITIVYFEHLIATLASFIWLMWFAPRDFFMGLSQTLGAALIGVFGSVLATLCFTESFRLVNPSVSILLQKIQPLVVIGLSWLFLGERITRTFFLWATLALISAFFLTFPEGVRLSSLLSQANHGAALAFLAAVLWATSTVIGKASLGRANPAALSFWRFASGLILLLVLMRRFPASAIEVPFVWGQSGVLRSIAYMAIIPGFFGVYLYYRGLKKVSASSATLLELSFPLTAVAINAIFLDLHLGKIQLLAGCALLISMIGVGMSSKAE
ncbi:MAG: EamA family transporter [Bdellovibrionales bacterium]|nr:EamA family transporter [Bdellovibrionales bacterium]